MSDDLLTKKRAKGRKPSQITAPHSHLNRIIQKRRRKSPNSLRRLPQRLPNQPRVFQSRQPPNNFSPRVSQKALQKDYDEAITSLSECLRLKPDAVECYAFRGFALGMKGDSTEAKPDFETAIKMAPNQPEIYLMRGLTFVRIGNKAEAVKGFRNVLRIDPNNREAKAALQQLGEQP